jgi:hypothetical protein
MAPWVRELGGWGEGLRLEEELGEESAEVVVEE